MSIDKGLARWLNTRAKDWQSVEETADRVQRGRDHTVDDALTLIDGYRSLGRDLSIARRVLPRSRTTQGLEALYARLHSAIHRPAHNWGATLRTLFRDEIPAAAYEIRLYILWIALLFALTAGAGWWLVSEYPEMVGLFASEKMIAEVESGRLWTDGLLNVVPSSVLSVQILANNIMVSIVALCVGIFFGLGTFYIISLNGLMLGGVFAFTHQHGLAGNLMKFIVAHGFVELSVICIAGAAGMALGASIAIPTHATRRESFQRAAGQAARVILLCAILLVICGFIEGYISPDDSFSMPVRLAVGVGYWILMIAAFSGHLTRRMPR